MEQDVTELLAAWSAGDEEAFERLMPLVIDDLRSLARAYMAGEAPGHTLQPTALVNEAYLRLERRRELRLINREQLFALLSVTMRRVLVDHARRKKAARHGGGKTPVPLEDVFNLPIHVDRDLVALDEALKDLASLAPRQSRAVTLSYFGGMSFDEIAKVLGVSASTVKRDLEAARTWLLFELRGDP